MSAAAPAGAGHDNIDVDRSLARHAGKIVSVGAPDGEGHVYSFRLARLPAAPGFAVDELRGWRLTILAGKRFAAEFRVRSNTHDQIVIAALDGPLDGLAAGDLFVVEDIKQ